jgi:hypothetical protein
VGCGLDLETSDVAEASSTGQPVIDAKEGVSPGRSEGDGDRKLTNCAINVSLERSSWMHNVIPSICASL